MDYENNDFYVEDDLPQSVRYSDVFVVQCIFAVVITIVWIALSFFFPSLSEELSAILTRLLSGGSNAVI